MANLPADTAASAPVLPHVAVAVYLVCVVGAGILANAAVLAALFRRERNVFHSIVMQLAAADVLLLCGAAGFETWTRNEGTWNFGSSFCVVYLGCEIFASTASVYFVATLALHALATANLEESNRMRRPKLRDDDSDEVETRGSRHSLMANSDSSTPPRTMNIDYRIADTAVPVAVPVVFVWVLAASLSVPEFALGTTLHTGGVTLCTISDPSHRFNMHTLRAAFELFLPVFILSSAGALALSKLRKRSRKRLDDGGEVDAALMLSIWLAGIYLVLNAPRSTLAAYHAYVTPQGDFRNPLLSVDGSLPGFALTVSFASYAAALLRPIFCVFVLPELRRSFSFAKRERDRGRVI